MVLMIQILCESKHCLAAALFDEAVPRPEVIDKLFLAMIGLKISRICAICHSGKGEIVTKTTRFATMADYFSQTRTPIPTPGIPPMVALIPKRQKQQTASQQN